MIKYMLDTNICIYIIKKKPTDVIERFRQTPISQIGISSITLSELEYGVAKSSKPDQNQFALAQFLAPMEILPYSRTTIWQASGLVRKTRHPHWIP
jgi:tRNA(fMet)-specific endonuclease VapC